jgi:hypothetical protein
MMKKQLLTSICRALIAYHNVNKPTTNIFDPSFENRSAIDRPIPMPEPVTTEMEPASLDKDVMSALK